VLLSNHYHLMVETPEANLVTGMKWLHNTYTRRHNCRHRLWGRLFGDRYKAILNEGRLGLLLLHAHGLRPLESGAGRVGAGGTEESRMDR
jgi:REP-associated tyrosine transposase